MLAAHRSPLIALFSQMGHALLTSENLDSMLKKVLDLVFENLPAQRGCIYLYDASTDSLTEKTVSVRVAQTASTNDKIYLAVLSKSNNCFFIRHVNTPLSATNTIPGSYQAEVKGVAAGECSAAVADVPADNDAAWKVL